MKQSQAFHKGIRRVWSRLPAGSGTSRQDKETWRVKAGEKLYALSKAPNPKTDMVNDIGKMLHKFLWVDKYPDLNNQYWKILKMLVYCKSHVYMFSRKPWKYSNVFLTLQRVGSTSSIKKF